MELSREQLESISKIIDNIDLTTMFKLKDVIGNSIVAEHVASIAVSEKCKKPRNVTAEIVNRYLGSKRVNDALKSSNTKEEAICKLKELNIPSEYCFKILQEYLSQLEINEAEMCLAKIMDEDAVDDVNAKFARIMLSLYKSNMDLYNLQNMLSQIFKISESVTYRLINRYNEEVGAVIAQTPGFEEIVSNPTLSVDEIIAEVCEKLGYFEPQVEMAVSDYFFVEAKKIIAEAKLFKGKIFS